MNSEELRELEALDLLKHIEKCIQGARSSLEGSYLVPKKTPKGMNLPLCQIHDIEIWPRDFDSEKRCQECGSPTLGMMVLRGPMACFLDSPERVFCSLHCFWKWIHQEQNERDAGGLISGKREWKGTVGKEN